MKRTELKRSPSSSSLKRKQPKRTPGQDEFWRAVTSEGRAKCWFDERSGSAYECDYMRGFDAHHLIPKQRINAATNRDLTMGFAAAEPVLPDQEGACHLLSEVLADPRNGIALCRFHHSQLEAHRIKLTASDLPPSVLEFAKDYGLEAILDRIYPKENAA